MDGSSYPNKVKLPANSSGIIEEVIFLTDFIFDLQRFTATTWLLSGSDSAWTLTEEGNTGNIIPSSGTVTNLTDLFADPRVTAGDTIKLNPASGNELTTGSQVDIAKDLTIDLNGKTFKSSVTSGYAINVTGRTLTVKGAGGSTILSSNDNNGSGLSALVGVNGGHLVFEGQYVTLGDDTNVATAVEIGTADSSFDAGQGKFSQNTSTNPLYVKNTGGGTVNVSSVTNPSQSADTEKFAVLNIEGTTGYYSHSTTATSLNAVAQVGDFYYPTLQKAIDAAQELTGDAAKVTLLAAIDTQAKLRLSALRARLPSTWRASALLKSQAQPCPASSASRAQVQTLN